jgi:hypothetical protein
MVTMRSHKAVRASHEPGNPPVDFQALAIFRFMGSVQFKKEQAALHESLLELVSGPVSVSGSQSQWASGSPTSSAVIDTGEKRS